MPSESGTRRWAAGAVLLVLLVVFLWLGRRSDGPGATVPSAVDKGAEVAVMAAEPVPSLTPLEEMDPDLAPALPAGTVPPAGAARDPDAEMLTAEKEEPVFQLPTGNAALFAKEPDKFFMFVDRYTPTGQVQVWQGGDYGFVRNPRQTEQGTIYTKFHEGIDIAPAARDAKGEPLDDVTAIADGTVAYITNSPRTSNYGHYVVVLHPLAKSGVFYSLYAHLRTISAVIGTPVRRGEVLGKLGYTGDGIDRRRAHVHLEIGLVLSERFDEHYGKISALANGHGNYHGSNLIGLNAAGFLTAHHADPKLMPDEFLKRQDVYYKVTVPNRGHELELAVRYPWLRQAGPPGTPVYSSGGQVPAAWEISFTGPGVPVAVAPSAQAVAFPTVSWVRPFAGYHSWNTRSLLGGSGNAANLTAEGNRFMTFVAGDF